MTQRIFQKGITITRKDVHSFKNILCYHPYGNDLDYIENSVKHHEPPVTGIFKPCHFETTNN